jgi:uncharacterized protein (TIGR02246 family)
MKIRLLIFLGGLAIGLVLPVIAQQEDSVDPKIAEQIRAFTMKYEEALNEHDAAAAAAFFTEDAVWRTPQGTFYGRRAIEKRLASYHFQQWHVQNEVINVDRVIAVGNEIRAIGTWSNTVQGPDGRTNAYEGHFTSVLVFEGDALLGGNAWKIRMNTYDQSKSD